MSEQQWRALQRETRSDRTGAANSKVPAVKVAVAAGVSRKTVYGWRKDAAYQAGAKWLLTEKLVERLQTRQKAEAKADAEERIRILPKPRESLDELWAAIKQHEPWPVLCHHCAQTFDTPQTYFEHLMKIRAAWIPDPADVSPENQKLG